MSRGPALSLGYVLLYVRDVGATLSFYEAAFGLRRRMFHQDGDKGYGELETGATRLGFVSEAQATEVLGIEPMLPTRGAAPAVAEIAFVTADVSGAFQVAVANGAEPFATPVSKPWGQVVAYVRDPDGHLVELCSPMG